MNIAMQTRGHPHQQAANRSSSPQHLRSTTLQMPYHFPASKDIHKAATIHSTLHSSPTVKVSVSNHSDFESSCTQEGDKDVGFPLKAKLTA
jgi:hypothetical protein